MPEAADALTERVAAELDTPPPTAVAQLAAALRDELGPATRAVLFYGSCLRDKTTEGVIDFYAVVDDYAAVYESRVLALANRWLPPNVFQRAHVIAGQTLLCKVAVVSAADLVAGSGLDAAQPTLWARLSQPVGLAYVRDRDARRQVAEAIETSICSAVAAGIALQPGETQRLRIEPGALFSRTFRYTRSAEWRVESASRARTLVAADAARYAAITRAALARLDAARELTLLGAQPGCVEIAAGPAGRRALRRRLARRRIAAKLLYFAGLLKTAFTFGDWVPYAVYKIEKHSGEPLLLSDRQRRHPLLFGWPVALRLLRRRVLR